MEKAEREEIQRHIDALNRAWQSYDQVAEREDLPYIKARKSKAYMAEVNWLAAHGISEVTDLTYSDETLTYSLPGGSVV